MKTFLTAALLTLASLSPLLAEDRAGVIPLGNNEFDFLYDRLERSNALSLDRTDWQLGPYDLNRLTIDHRVIEDILNVNGDRLSLFGSISEDLRVRKDFDPTGYEAYRAGLAARPLDRLYLFANFVLDQERAVDPGYTGKKWRGLAGDVEQAFAAYQTGRFKILAGRFGSFWGTRHSLVLGPSARMDGFGYNFRWGRITLSYRLAALDGVAPPSDSVGNFVNRYWAGHRVDVHVSDKIRAGVFETIVWGGPGRTIEAAYLNPLLSFHTFQLNRGPNDNSFLGIDFDLKPRNGLDLYGQVLIDDFQIDKKTQGDQKPNLFGLLGGFYWADVAPKSDLSFEYSRVTNRTYNQFFSWNRYLYEGRPIAGVPGNDYDLATFAGYHWLKPNLRGSLTLSLYRQGEGTIADVWTTPWLDITGPYHEKFPSGVVEKTIRAGIGLKGFISDFLYLDAVVGLDRILNQDHVAGKNRTEPFLQLKLSALASTLLNLR